MARLTLGPADRDALAAAGVTEAAGGVLRDAAGGEVAPGVAVQLLKTPAAAPPPPAGGRDGSAIPAPLGQPGDYARPLITPGHQSDSPANTGARAAAPVPAARPAEAADFGRGPLEAGQESPSPAGDPAGNAPYPPPSLAAAGYLMSNVESDRASRLVTGMIPSAEPAPARLVMTPDLRTASVPRPADMTMTAPGERR